MFGLYKAVNLKDKETLVASDIGENAGLSRHCYIGSVYVNVILNEIYEGSWKNKPLAWVNDNTRSKKFAKPRDEAIRFDSCSETPSQLDFSDAIIINNTKKEFIDLAEYKLNYLGSRENIIHPFPILTNSQRRNNHYMDYTFETKHRGSWAGHQFVVTKTRLGIPSHYKNISSEILLYDVDNEQQMDLLNDIFKRRALAKSQIVDLTTNERPKEIKRLDSDAPREKIVEALKMNAVSEIIFKKADGSRAYRNGTLDPNYEGDDSKTVDTRYVWFYDTDEKKMKKFIYTNFIGLELVA